jgi:hypothetical protein
MTESSSILAENGWVLGNAAEARPQVVDEHTIRVTPDVQGARRELELTAQKTIVPTDPTNAASLLNILRTAFGLRGVQLDEKSNIVIRDLPDNVAMAEKLVEVLGKGAVQP